jgi:hypothetical protein
LKPTEHEMTVAVEAVGRHIWDQGIAAGTILSLTTSWDDLSQFSRLPYREAALPLVVVALEAIPDRAAAVAARVRQHCCTCGTFEISGQDHESWCPASVVDELLAEGP